MPNTYTFLTYPTLQNGVSVTSGSSWAFGSWVTLAERTPVDIYIQALRFQVTNVPSADTTYQQLFEIGIGAQNSEVTKIQIPYSFRADTAVGYYVDTLSEYLPEPYFVPMYSRIAVRAANSVASNVTYNGVKISYQTVSTPIISNAQPNNYQFPRSVSAGIMSVGERIR